MPKYPSAVWLAAVVIVGYHFSLLRPHTAAAQEAPVLNATLEEKIRELTSGFDAISEQRKRVLLGLSSFIGEERGGGQPVRLTFICTHNSRRSHMSQIWAQTAAAYYGVDQIQTFSGGTEATAFNPRAVAAMRRAGFGIEKTGEDDNPKYLVLFDPQGAGMTVFSKVYDQAPNPSESFCAVMTCSQADKACPIVKGADERFAIPYEDPKAFDGTLQESSAYDERSDQIGREMLFVFANVAK